MQRLSWVVSYGVYVMRFRASAAAASRGRG